ncbi:hypothetical protein CBR_g18683 [Chara braunii]|uniref:lipoyl(octanoyl) transferase n=1 Tax=Chara braunii TaxID=69332 RepID=A0A388KWB2_CHABU|nr:hypothetical protein CBR_g18683 [Chara braunii]|eukprot:GBG74272.1 hypothetical protein CBR_g18683 [Chara braunii]
MSAMVRSLSVVRLGLTRYAPMIRLMEALADRRRDGLIGESLLTLQHHPVYTMGKRPTEHHILVSDEKLRELGAEVHKVPRGGEVTFHGPGQIVCYPIISLRELRLGPRAYVEALEDVMVDVAALYGVQARGRLSHMTGVWVGDRKIGAIGIRVSRGGITTHGLAFNVNPNLEFYKHIIPCGMEGKGVTSLQVECAEREVVDPSVVREQLVASFMKRLNLHERTDEASNLHVVASDVLQEADVEIR